MNWIDTLLIDKTRQSINKSIHRIPKEKRFVSSEPFLFYIKLFCLRGNLFKGCSKNYVEPIFVLFSCVLLQVEEGDKDCER